MTFRSLIMRLGRFSGRVRSLAFTPVRFLYGMLISFFRSLRKAWGSVMVKRGAKTALMLVAVAGVTAGFNLGLRSHYLQEFRSHYIASPDKPDGPPAMGKPSAIDGETAESMKESIEKEVAGSGIAEQGPAAQGPVGQSTAETGAASEDNAKDRAYISGGDLPAKAEDAMKAGDAAQRENEKLMMPVSGKIICSFGWSRHPVYGDWRFHPGLDIEVPPGTPVRAALSGRIIQVGEVADYGMSVSISHAGGMSTFYGHLGSVTVHVGDIVKQGEIIGVSGDTGVTTVPQVYFEVRKGQEPVEPDRL